MSQMSEETSSGSSSELISRCGEYSGERADAKPARSAFLKRCQFVNLDRSKFERENSGGVALDPLFSRLKYGGRQRVRDGRVDRETDEEGDPSSAEHQEALCSGTWLLGVCVRAPFVFCRQPSPSSTSPATCTLQAPGYECPHGALHKLFTRRVWRLPMQYFLTSIAMAFIVLVAC